MYSAPAVSQLNRGRIRSGDNSAGLYDGKRSDGDCVVEDRRGERPEAFAALDLSVQKILDVVAARITEDRATAKSARPPFHPPLKPADDLSVRDRLRGAS